VIVQFGFTLKTIQVCQFGLSFNGNANIHQACGAFDCQIFFIA
jgi:hypothetical protein